MILGRAEFGSQEEFCGSHLGVRGGGKGQAGQPGDHRRAGGSAPHSAGTIKKLDGGHIEMPKVKEVVGLSTTASKTQLEYSEQDTADKLILPFLHKQYGFPHPESLDYQSQHTVTLSGGGQGRYDGIYLNGGYPYAILEAKKFSHDLTLDDARQARAYATSDFFDKPVPFLVVSNGRDHSFFKRKTELDPSDGLVAYAPITLRRIHCLLTRSQPVDKPAKPKKKSKG